MSKKSIFVFLMIIGIAIVIIFAVVDIKNEKGLVRTKLSSTDNKPSGLKEAVDRALTDSKGTYGVVIKNLTSGEIYNLNENKTFNPGSLYKLWVMIVTFQQIEQGQVDKDEVLSANIQDLNNEFGISRDVAEMTEGEITLTVHDALEQMITISHNYAALLLIERIKRSTISNFLQNYGFMESTTGDEQQTTPKEIAVFSEKLYRGELANPDNTAKMLDLLKRQTKNEKLPKYLPERTIIAHKTGEIDNFSHDAGIVFAPLGNYVIVVMSESDSPYGAEERIANISKAVYDYFERR